jgi:hypothetical protein
MVREVISRLALNPELPCASNCTQQYVQRLHDKTKMEYKYFCMTLSYAS